MASSLSSGGGKANGCHLRLRVGNTRKLCLLKQKTLKLSKLYWVSLKAAIADIQEKNVALIAAGVAFYGMLSLFPALAALVTILSLISDPVVVIAQLDDMRGLLPDDVYKIINEQVVTLVTASTSVR